MSNDLLLSNGPSSLSDSNSNHGNNNHSNHCSDTIIGQEFASSILLADLAIQSTAYIRPSTSTEALEKNETKKQKRRVTFKDDIQVLMIPVYSSCSSASTSSEDLALVQEQPKIQPVSDSEKIQKASVDACQSRKQVRRRNTPHSSSKSGFWYPLNPSPTTTTNNGMIRHSSHLLPALRSLEMTERLISESIEREMALYPNLKQQEESPSSSMPPISDQPTSILIIDSDDEEEEEEQDLDGYFTSHEDQEQDSYQSRLEIAELEKTPSLEGSTHSDYRQSITLDNEQHAAYNEDSDTSITTSSPQPTTTGFEEKFQPQHTILYSPPEHTFPLEKNFISVPTKSNHHIPPTSAIDFIHPVHHLFFIKVLKAEQLDFPIENDSTDIYCSIRYKNEESRSIYQPLFHTMDINHEMRIVDVDPNQQVALTIHVGTNRGKKSNPAFSTWYHKMKSSSDLERYVHEKDGSICQTLFSPNRFIGNVALERTASLMLVNSWYRIHPTNNSPSSLLSFKKKKLTSPAALAQEKAVGKIIVKCLAVEAYGDRLPETMDEALEGINANRFHHSIWQSGYLSQGEGDEKKFTKKYFTLKGGVLFTDEDRVGQISLTSVVKLACNTHIIAERHDGTMEIPATTLLKKLEHVIMSKDKELPLSKENDFQLYMENGQVIQFGCESIQDRNKWVSIIQVMICKLPIIPDWIKSF